MKIIKPNLFCTLFLSIFLTGLVACQQEEMASDNSLSSIRLTDYVDPFIGSGFHGHVFVGANVPFGAVQLGPVNITEGWDWCSGYHYSDSTIIGFSHTHLSGTGIGDLGDILVMPAIGDVKIRKGEAEKPETGYFSYFSHHGEKAKAGFYQVHLDRYAIDAEMTTTERVGFHRYTFPQAEDAKLIIDLEEGIGWDRATDTYVEMLDEQTLIGHRHSSGWAKDQKVFFAAKVSKPIKSWETHENGEASTNESRQGKKVKAVAHFDTQEGEQILLKVAISPVSAENALMNMEEELAHWDFDQTVALADEKWEKELRLIQADFNEPHQMRTFYTALYHTMIAPSIFNDVNGAYRGADGKVYEDNSYTNYTTFSLWDTYRAAHPLYTIIQHERAADMMQTMLNIYEQQGKLPVWHLMGNETNTMVGYSAVPVLVDAFRKGIKMDEDKAYEAIKATAMRDEDGLGSLKSLGYIPADEAVETVASGLEYALADWSIAQMAKDMGKEEDYRYFMARASNYKNYFDETSGFMRGRVGENEWRSPFSPFESRHMKDDFCEGNAWQYTWLVPHDVEGLMELLGGEEAFANKLDSLFIVEGDMGEEASSDITGLIGQYAHGNEPSHHVTYLYGYVGQPYKTAEKTRHIMDSLYSDQIDGLSGNEDVGQMSAWYVLSSLGFYPVNPANGTYVFGSPLVNHAKIRVGDDQVFEIKVKDNSPENIYVQSMKWDGQEYTRNYFHHKDLIKGGVLEIQMGPSPSPYWGTHTTDRARSNIN
ncbi:GH92 family glycosyl hydrolase [Litoribacter alkaliphilus]|uniref:GH92 family glycosyl hydrolase n=1 Tax=Litoribacter ruber TaxID=702568 RepID=A0AAP2CL33_9BACT|nr:GH92 family glycosyl hydrolase [Litoribacter alkaliphilus]MBS9523827.1 GH92 family glycosyl hydrolase [Litoribacter alkaliphilus]